MRDGEVIKDEVEAREISDTIKVTKRRQSDGVNSRRLSNLTASALLVNGAKLLCVYCKGDHF